MAADAVTESFRFPDSSSGRADSGAIDVTRWSSNPALNANPVAGNNDFSALQAVINAYAGSNRIIYFPPGEYEIDQQLVMPIITSNRATTRTSDPP